MRVLHIEDNADDAELIRRLLVSEWPACDLIRVGSRPAFEAALGSGVDVILSDCALPGFGGFEALEMAKARYPDVPFIFVSGTLAEEVAIRAVRQGADDYVLKDRLKRLVTAIERALRDADERNRRKQAELRSRELADCLNQANEAVILTDLAGRVTFWNRGAQRLSGCEAAEALGCRFWDLLPPDTAERVAAGFRAAEIDSEWSGILDLKRRDGVLRTVQMTITATPGTEAHGEARLVLATDITARRAAERRVQQQAEMLNQASEAIFITDLAERVIYWNAGAERMLGVRTADILGRTVREVFSEDTAEQLESATRALETWHGELCVTTRRGDRVVLDSRCTVIRDDLGQPKARLSINSDISERKRLEEQFLRAQRMENLGLLAAGIAHDLNNMLAPILLAAPMMSEFVTDASAQQLLQTMERSAERGAQLVRQIMSFAQGASNEHHLVQTKHLLRDVSAVIAGTFPKSIQYQEQVPSDLWAIHGNPTQIHQVVLNLCVNARDAMPAGGTLRVRAENRRVAEAATALAPGAYLVITVEDTGMGIPPEILGRIWEPFFTTKGTGKGTGLGLSTVRGIVESHRGFVDVTSRVGQGSTFSVYFPAAEVGSPAGSRAAARSVPHGNGELILVVDDEQQIRDMTSAILRRYGYRVLLASDGAEAANLFAQHAAEIRLVISDLHMPKVDGATLSRALRQINGATRMLVMSGMASGFTEQSTLEHEGFADAVLLKPFKPEALLECVQGLLDVGAEAVALPSR